jgi:hypothetical protein
METEAPNSKTRKRKADDADLTEEDAVTKFARESDEPVESKPLESKVDNVVIKTENNDEDKEITTNDASSMVDDAVVVKEEEPVAVKCEEDSKASHAEMKMDDTVGGDVEPAGANSASNEPSDAMVVKEEMDYERANAADAKSGRLYEGQFCKVPIDSDDTEDVDDIQESEHFDTRQSFLYLCQGNHYQFDQLRRAKHTSMMVLYHIHNPDAPKFVHSCTTCHKDILVGNRYHCDTCEIDYCQSCLDIHGNKIHQHSLRMFSIGSNTQPKALTEEQKRERERNIQLHMQ